MFVCIAFEKLPTISVWLSGTQLICIIMENEGNDAKGYREKTDESKVKKHTYRKNRSRVLLKNNADAYGEHKRKKRERKYYSKVKKN